MEHIRVWKEFDLQEIQKHLVIVDDISGYCPQCKKIGIPIQDLAKCPSCGAEFKYMSTQQKQRAGDFSFVMSLCKKLPHLILIDYDDYLRSTSKKKAETLFGPAQG